MGKGCHGADFRDDAHPLLERAVAAADDVGARHRIEPQDRPVGQVLQAEVEARGRRIRQAGRGVEADSSRFIRADDLDGDSAGGGRQKDTGRSKKQEAKGWSHGRTSKTFLNSTYFALFY